MGFNRINKHDDEDDDDDDDDDNNNNNNNNVTQFEFCLLFLALNIW